MPGKYDDILDLIRLHDATLNHPHTEWIRQKALMELKRINKETKKVVEEDLKKEKEEEEAETAKKATEDKARYEEEAKAAEAGKTEEKAA